MSIYDDLFIWTIYYSLKKKIAIFLCEIPTNVHGYGLGFYVCDKQDGEIRQLLQESYPGTFIWHVCRACPWSLPCLFQAAHVPCPSSHAGEPWEHLAASGPQSASPATVPGISFPRSLQRAFSKPALPMSAPPSLCKFNSTTTSFTFADLFELAVLCLACFNNGFHLILRQTERWIRSLAHSFVGHSSVVRVTLILPEEQRI